MKSHYHFIGIAGIGMSGLARLVLEKGSRVSGSDTGDSSRKTQLRELGAQIFEHQHKDHLPESATVIYSSDIHSDNPEFTAACELGLPLLHRSELLQLLASAVPYPLAVTGTHGKTTTSAILTTILQKAALAPSFAIGGELIPLGINSALGSGKHFVFEADESDGSMLHYTPYGTIITNLDSDHLAHYGSMEALELAITSFALKTQSSKHLIWCGDDERLMTIGLPGISYGFSKRCQARILRSWQRGWKSFFDLEWDGKLFEAIELSLPGKHMVLNATAACCLAIKLGIHIDVIRQALIDFSGVKRRLEKVAEPHHQLIIDDYAHHPTEIASTLDALRGALGERRLIAIYQPHRYSRMATLPADLFPLAFANADEVYITEVYSSGEEVIEAVNLLQITEQIRLSGIPTHFCAGREQLVKQLLENGKPHDIFVFMGAGNITETAHSFADQLSQSAPRKWRIGLTCGGPSPEHAIALRSAELIKKSLNPNFYDITYFGVDRNGRWNTGPDILTSLPCKDSGPMLSGKVLDALQQCDLFFPIMHGPYGEDGIVQGFFEVLGKPYIGCNHRSAALCMDKVLSKKIALHHGIPVAPFVHFSAALWQNSKKKLLKKVLNELPFPLIVKPSHIGSSIGLALVKNSEELIEAIDEVFQTDDEVIIEERLYARDIEFALFGRTTVTTLPPGEILNGGKPYDYVDKVGKNHPPTTTRAEMPQEWAINGMKAAETIYSACGCEGLARVDFLLDVNGTFWFNEINPIPGMTQISLYPQMCLANGINFSDLTDQFVIHALARERSKRRRALYTPSMKVVGN